MEESVKIETAFTRLVGCDLPILAAPMFLVSNTDIVVEASEAGGVGAFPSLTYRPVEKLAEALAEMKRRTKKPIAMNIIVNKTNSRQNQDLRIALDAGVQMFITSLGSPKTVIEEAHKIGAKVFCDVTNLEHALKVQDMGADGVVAVASGAGGHAGPISPLVLIPWLKTKLSIPIVCAGGISHGSQIAAALALGADAVSIGTRFIASREAGIDQTYKDAVVRSTPEDIVMTTRLSGTPAAVIRTPYIEKMGLDLPLPVKILKENPLTKKYVMPVVHWAGLRALEQAAEKPTWKTVWSAGQSVGLVDEVLSVREIFAKLTREYAEASAKLPRPV